MTLRLSDLSAHQIRMMIRLDDGFPHEDSVGLEVSDLRPGELPTVNSLLNLGLAEISQGRKLQFWFRLTEAGRKVREEGGA